MWVLLLLVGALLIKKWRTKLLWLSFLFFFIFGNGFLFDEVVRPYEASLVKREMIPPTEVAIVLGGYSTYDPEHDMINFREATDRVLHTFHLYQTKKIEKVFISGGSGSLVGLDQEGVYMYDYLLDLGIKPRDLIVDSISKNTRENALNSATLIEDYKLTTPCLLVTSALHMPRGIKCFKKVGIEVIPFPVDKITGPRKYYFDHLFVPSIETMANWQRFFHELLGLFAYKIMGYV